MGVRPPVDFLTVLVGVVTFFCMAVLYLFEVVYIPRLRQLERHERSIALLGEIFEDISSGSEFNFATSRALAPPMPSEGGREEIRQLVDEALAKDDRASVLERRMNELIGELERMKVLVGRLPKKESETGNFKLQEESRKEAEGMPAETTAVAINKKEQHTPWRSDFKCGAGWPSDDGTREKSECNPDGEFPCCSTSGWCGISRLHCECPGCIDYRQVHAAEVSVPETRDKRIAIIIPYRDRESHYQKFERHFADFVRELNVENRRNQEFHIFLVEQFDNQLFNRGWLFNVGFTEALRSLGDRKPDCIVMQDVDNLPMSGVDFGSCSSPVQLSSEIECWGWSVPYPGNVGGTVAMNPDHWKRINGFSNEYWGWGGEDDDLYWRLRHNQLLVGGCNPFCQSQPGSVEIFRPRKGHGKFLCLHDNDHTPRRRPADDKPLWDRLQRVRSGDMIWRGDGINNVEYRLINEFVKGDDSAVFANIHSNDTIRGFTLHWKSVASKLEQKSALDRTYLIAPGGFCGTGVRVPLKKVPSDLDELREILPDRCRHDDELRFLAVDFNRQLGTVIDHHWRLQRFIRTLPTSHSGVIHALHKKELNEALEKGKHRRYIRDFPACIGQANDGSGAGLKHRVNVGTDWCGDQGWTHLLGFKVLHPDDVKYVSADDLLTICISVSPQGWVYRFIELDETSSPSSACPSGYDERSRKTWNHEKMMYIRKSSEGEAICVGYFTGSGHARWMAASVSRSGGCDNNGYVHEFTFHSMTNNYQPVITNLCVTAVGDSPSVKSVEDLNCPEKDILRVFRTLPSKDMSTIPLCWADSTLRTTDGECLGGSLVFALRKSKSEQDSKMWCLDGSTLTRGDCDGTFLYSAELEDVDGDVVTFLDDAIL
ncbi:hypothetical protein FOZ63_022579 [Perkinsus olseni]|uniref:Uncharacterized protein n=1 Tax=Perkinsus olseni TaxID=32597 RepID=A0A7J6SKW7_PEROL|nr:hypothetical protein FOZ62_004780 [Perkinsus olseni]KAF4742295.1 hypothetical protein FOZ63_022579 [Perkinsus olseni]